MTLRDPAATGKVLVATTLVTASSASAREAALAQQVGAALAAARQNVRPELGEQRSKSLPQFAVLLEGLASGQGWLEQLQQQYPQNFTLQRIAPGCLCCSGSLVMQVSLNRLLRQQPEQLWIGIANTDHLAQIQTLLQNPPYDSWLQLRSLCSDPA